jgi:lysophospholipase L1-like esterase
VTLPGDLSFDPVAESDRPRREGKGREGKNSGMNPFFARVALVLVGLAIGLGAADLCVRSLLDLFVCHEHLGWTFEPGGSGWRTSRSREYLVRANFNSLGIRDDERSEGKPTGAYRILILGDSTVASMQVARELSYPAILETMLDAKQAAVSTGGSVEVINAGVDGYGTGQALLMYREHGSRMDPSLVVLGVFLSNDIADNWIGAGNVNHYLAGRCGRPYFAIEGDVLVPVDGGNPVQVVTSFFDRVLRLSILYSNYVITKPTSGRGLDFAQSQAFEVPRLPVVERAFQLTERLLSELNAEVANDGRRLAVLIMAEKMQVGQNSAIPNKVRPDYSHALGSLTAHLDRESIPYFDLVPALTAQFTSGGPLPFYEIDSHLNEVGHQVAGAAIFGWLMEHCREIAPGLPGCPAGFAETSASGP